jgi:hypothetical protein
MSRTILAALLVASPATAGVPLVFSHHGRLLDPTDAPVNGALDITVRIHKKDVDAQNEDNLVWEDTYDDVQVTDGSYSIVIGPVDASDWDGVDPRWLAVKIGSDAEMAPRLQIGSVPFALRALSASMLNGKTDADFAAASHAHADLAPLTHTHTAANTTDFAAAAVAAMGQKANTNPLHHDRYGDTDAVAAVEGADLYWTKTELASTGTGVVDWSRLSNVPSGFADGTDDGNTYGALPGGGLDLSGANQFSIATGGVTPAMLASNAGAFAKVTGGALTLQGGNLGIGSTTPSGPLQIDTSNAGYVKDNPPSGAYGNFGLTGFVAGNISNGTAADTGWHTDSSNNTAYLKIDLGQGTTKDYTKLRIYSHGGYNGVWDFEYSDNDSNWTTVAASIRPSIRGWHERAWSSVGPHRYWRLKLTNSPGGGAWLGELELFRPAAGPAFIVTPNGYLIRKVHRAVGYAELSGDSYDPVPGRVLDFRKERDDTWLRVTYYDDRRNYGTDRVCQWEVRFDNKRCVDPGMVADTVYWDRDINHHSGRTLIGYCRANEDGALNAGLHNVKVVLRNSSIPNLTDSPTGGPSYTSGSDCHMGWPQWSGRQFVLEVEEVL